jgi:hypothetical protein
MARSASATVNLHLLGALAGLALLLGRLTLAVLTAQAAAPQASRLDVVISEVAWMGTTASAADE